MSQRFVLSDAVITDKLLGYYAGYFKRNPTASVDEAKAYAEQQVATVDLARHDLNPWSHFAYLLQPKPSPADMQEKFVAFLADPAVLEMVDFFRPASEPAPAPTPKTSAPAKAAGRK